MTAAAEIRRLREGPLPGEVPGGVGLTEVVATTPGDAVELLDRCREVLLAVLQASADEWPTDPEWREVLPPWFVAGCAPEETPEENARWLAWWRGLPEVARGRAAQERPWTLTGWLYWLQPDERQWYWWNGVARTPHEVLIIVEAADWPTPTGALVWLLRTAGAASVQVLD